MARLSTQEIEAIRKRAMEATEGPWHYYFTQGIAVKSQSTEVLDAETGVICYPDAEFIANSREDIPKLLAEVERLRSEVKSTYLALCVLHDINGVTVMNSDSIRVLRKSLLEAII